MKKLTTSEQLTQLLDKFRLLREDNTRESIPVYNNLLKTELDLPYFYTFAEPVPTYDAYILATPNKKTPYEVYVTNDKGKSVREEPYTTLAEAYDAVNKLKGNCVFSGNLAVTGNDEDKHFITEKGRLLLTVLDEDTIWLAKTDYLSWLFSTETYRADPNNFLAAYRWVCRHPAFWSRATENSFNWQKDATFWFDVACNKKQELVYMLEAGAAVEPTRTHHYHDLRLDVLAPTFEEAYIQLAGLVDKFFNLDGSERENVSYEPSELEKKLTETIKNYNEQEGTGTDENV